MRTCVRVCVCVCVCVCVGVVVHVLKLTMNEFHEPSACEHHCKHCRVSSLVIVCRRSLAAKANLLAIETALLTRRQQSADHKVCQVGVSVNTDQ